MKSNSVCDAEGAWRGAFLAHGSLTEPGRSSSLEVTCPGPEAALALIPQNRTGSILIDAGSTTEALAELLAATLNSVAFIWRTSPASTELEAHTLDWVAQLLGLGGVAAQHLDHAGDRRLGGDAAHEDHRPTGSPTVSAASPKRTIPN